MSNMMPGGTTKHPWIRPIDPAYFGDEAKATGATAGTPGTWTPAGSAPADRFADMTGIVASPATNWTVAQRVVLSDGTLAHWNGTTWVAGQHP